MDESRADTTLSSLQVVSDDDHDEIADVGYKNAEAKVWYVRMVLAVERNADPDELERQLWIGLPLDWPKERVLREWMPLRIYNIILENFTRILGNPEKLQEAATICGYRSSFGGMQLLVDVLLIFLRFIITPEMMFAFLIPIATTAYNVNKLVTTIVQSWKKVFHRLVYQANPVTGTRIRQPSEDHLSLVWWAPSFTVAATGFWFIRGQFVHHILELDLPSFLQQIRRFMVEHVSGSNHSIQINGVTVAKAVRLYREGETPYYTQKRPPSKDADGSAKDTDDYVTGYVVTEDVTVTTPDGESWTALRKGQIYSANAGCSIVEYVFPAPWWLYPAFRIFNMILGFGPIRRIAQKMMESRVREMEKMAWVERVNAQLDAEKRRRMHATRSLYPDAHVQELVELGLFRSGAIQDALIMAIDVANWTPTSEALGDEAEELIMRPFQELLFDIIDPYAYSNPNRDPNKPTIYYLEFTGDGGMVLFMDAEPGALVLTALEVASKLHEGTAEIIGLGDEPIHIRCGLEMHGDIKLWAVPQAPSRIHANGVAMNRAARFQDAGKNQLLAPGPGNPPGVTVLPKRLADLVPNKCRFYVPEEPMPLKGIDEPIHLVRFSSWTVF